MKTGFLLALCMGGVGAAGAQTDTVVVTATRHAMALLDAPAAMSVVTSTQIAERGADNVFEALRGETGVSLIGRTISGRRNLSLRGMEGRHTLFLVDGKRISASDGIVGHSDFQYDWVAVEEIDRIEVVRGPMSVLYGGEALGGVVNVITRKPGAAWAGRGLLESSNADAGRGGDGHRAALSLGGPLARPWRLAATVADSRRAAVDSVTEARLSDLEGKHKQDAALRLTWLAASGHEVELEQRVGNEARWAGVRERGGARRFHASLHDVDRSHLSLGWSGNWAGAWRPSTMLRTYGSRVAVDNTRTLGVTPLAPQTLNDRVIEGQGAIAPAAGQLFTAGFEWREEGLKNIGLPGGRSQARHQALFVQAELQLSSTLALTAGARHEGHEGFGAQWSPRVYAVWKPAPQWLVKGGAGHGFKAPNLKQIAPGYREDEGPNTYFGNPALRAESNDAAELALGWDSPVWAWQALLFHNRVNHLIVPRLLNTVAGRGQYVFENIDRARLQGLELESSAKLVGGWSVGGNYTYLDATDGKGLRLEKRPRHLFAMNVAWASGPWRAGLRVEHHAGQLIAPVVVGQPLLPVPDLSRAAAHITYKISRQLALSLGVDNLTQLSLAETSPLFTWAEAPRTWRFSLRGQW